jgi:putative FmdB family regulatory protein
VPIYEYVCQSCQHPFEQLVRSAREERTLTCPSCGSKQVDRQFSVIARPPESAAAPPPGPCGQCGTADGACPFQS